MVVVVVVVMGETINSPSTSWQWRPAVCVFSPQHCSAIAGGGVGAVGAVVVIADVGWWWWLVQPLTHCRKTLARNITE